MKYAILIFGLILTINGFCQRPKADLRVTLEYINQLQDNSEKIYIIKKVGVVDKDYVWERDTIKVFGSDFDSLTNIGKDGVGVYCATDMNTLIGYYMSLGMSQTQATMFYLDRRVNDVDNAGEAFCDRIAETSFRVVVLIFLGESQSLTFNDACRNFKEDLCSMALLGTGYGDSRDGIMDYIESTGSYTSGGLKSYTMSAEMEAVYGSQTLAREAMVVQLKNILIEGN